MNVLGSLGNLYMAVLLFLLFAGLIFAVYEMVKKIVGYISESRGQKGTTISSKFGGMTIMKSSGWLKLAVFSFVGLIISVVLLNVTNPTATSSTNDQHNLHVNGSANATGTMGNMSGTMNGTVNMDQMNEMMQRMNQLQQDMMMMQQQYMNGMQSQSNMNMGTSGGMGGSGGMMDMMNMGGMSGGSGSGSMGGSSGSMGMM